MENEQDLPQHPAAIPDMTPLDAFYLGMDFHRGFDFDRYPDKAFACYKHAAELGFVHAQCELGWLLRKGIGAPVDDIESQNWFAKASENESEYVQQFLADIIRGVRRFDKNEEIAAELFRKSAEQGIADSQYWLGLSYMCGYGVLRSRSLALEWLGKAASQGVPRALEKIRAIEGGDGKEYFEAAEEVVRLQPKAECGDLDAMCALGKLHLEVPGVKQDILKAKDLFRRAAEEGHAAAQFELGVMFAKGLPVKDLHEAAKWYRKASDQGHAEAKHWLTEMIRSRMESDPYFHGLSLELHVSQQ